MATQCPCCGTPVFAQRPLVDLTRNVVALDERSVVVRPKVAEFIDVLARAWPASVRKDKLIADVWGVNEPDTVDAQVRFLAYETRKALDGWPVTFRGTPAGYTMQWLS